MGEVIGDLLPLALGVAISPVPVIAVILMLMAPRAKAASVAFMIGWVLGVTLVVTVVTLLVPSEDSGSEEPSTWSSVVKILLGLLLVAIAVKQWRGRPRPGQEATLPAWMAAVDSMNAVKAGGLGLALSALNPKNLTLSLAAGVSIGTADLSGEETALCLLVFVVIASVTVAGPVLAYLVAHEQMRHPLEELRRWLTANNAVVMSVLLLVIGVALLGKGIGGLG